MDLKSTSGNNLKTDKSAFTRLWDRLTEPAVSIRDPEEARLSKLLASSLIAVLPLIILVGLVVMPIISSAPALWQGPTFLPALIAMIVSFISYGLNRRGKYPLASRLYIAMFVFSPWLAAYQDSNQINLPIAILMVGGVLMASVFTPGGVLVTAGISIAGVALLPWIKPGMEWAEIASVFSVIVTTNTLIILLTYYRNVLEKQRTAELYAKNINLQDSAEYYDARLAELIDTIVAMSSMDFDKRASVGENGDMFDALATGLNALGEELSASVVSREYLEQTVALRTSQLEAANTELSNFAYVASHDLKAPLRAISQLSSWIVEDYSQALDESGQEKLHLLIDRTKHMHNLIDGILQYSRIGRVAEKTTAVNLAATVRDIIKSLSLPETIQIIIEDPLPIVTGESTLITQVFQNLLSNAIRYIDKQEGYIRIRYMIEKDHWLFSVADNGPGIEEKYFSKIFQIFQTLGTRKDVDSTGIGLALVKRIVEKWGGKIWVESTVGQGSTFFFTMPKNRSEA